MKIKEYILAKEVLGPIIAIIAAILLTKITKKITKKLFKSVKKINSKKSQTVLSLINNIIKFFIWIIAILIVLSIYGVNTTSLVASLGVVGLVIGLALQDILKDFISGVSIIFDNQYALGETVEINGFKGEVIELGLRITKIKSFTGEVKMVSNRNITEIINYSINSNLAIIDIPVSYESNIQEVKKVLDSLSEKLITEYKLKEMNCIGIQELADSSIVFRLTAISTAMDKYEVSRIIRKEVVLELNKHKIEIPYQQVVIHSAK